MMFGDENNVAGPARGKQIGPSIGVKRGCRCVETLAEISIRRIAIVRFVVGCGGAARDARGILIPFGIGRMRIHIVIIVAQQIMNIRPTRGKGRN